MRIILFNLAGEEIDLASLGLVGLKLNIPSPSYRVTKEYLDGLAGEMVLEKVLNPRLLTADFLVVASDYSESLYARDRLYELLGNGQPFYVAEVYQPTKRWKVHLDGWEPERFNSRISAFSLPLFVESGTSETINVIENTFDTASFRFNNEGNVLVDPRTHAETEIKFNGESSGLVIRNLTTDDEWSYADSSVAEDTILLKGVRSLKNDVSIFGQTNKQIITLAPGWNDFEILNMSGAFEITIRTRFYFL